jgi:hypothetical protein
VAGKAILLSHVLSNLRMVPNYYERCTLEYTIGQETELYELIRPVQQAYGL